jgi:hypothetical protein
VVSDGSYQSTQASDDAAQMLSELHTSGKPSNRLSLLDHIWAFDVQPGANYTFSVEAYHTPNAEGDHFVFSYSLDDHAYVPMVTVTKTLDDDTPQTFAFPAEVSGEVYVRVQDTDLTPGNRGIDSLFVDAMVILTDTVGPDLTPPVVPDGLSAGSGDAQVTLEWTESGAADLAGYLVYRASGSSGAFAPLTGEPVAQNAFVDNSVENLELYRYAVCSVDGSDNTSPLSKDALAVPHPEDSGPLFVQVAQVKTGTATVSSGWKQGRAQVKLVDDAGKPVSGAVVTVTFSGDLNQTASATSNAKGVAVITTTQAEKGGLTVTACVDEVLHPSLFYVADYNQQTCDSN